MQHLSLKNVGAPNTHQEIKRLRRESGDMLRRYGEPVVYFRAINLQDLKDGTAKRCPACYDDAYAQSRADCEVCFNTTLVTFEDDPDHFIDINGYLTDVPTDVPAPLHGGYREPVITRIVQPDVGTDVMRWNEQGVLIRTQNATAVAYWSPTMGDNDMIVDCRLGIDQSKVTDVGTRYLLKQVSPATIRGWGRRKADQSYAIGQTFQMNSLPLENILYHMPIPVQYGEI